VLVRAPYRSADAAKRAAMTLLRGADLRTYRVIVSRAAKIADDCA
jgi:hypothetical protein